MHTLISLLLAILTLLAVSLQKTFHKVPIKEVKRRARTGDELANILYKAVSYGHTLSAVLWFFVGVFAAGFFVNVALYSPWWFALAASVALVWVGFVWLPARPVTKMGQQIAAWLAPVFAWILHYLHPLLGRLVSFSHNLRPVHLHTGLYQKEDLLELLELQQVQVDNRIEQAELDMAKHAMTFADKTIGEVMIPRRAVKMVGAKDTIGPVLLDELHKNNHSRFPVHEGSEQDNIVGILYLRDLLNVRSGGMVENKMHKGVCYVHEEQNLYDALQAILKTHQQLLVVVNSFEEYVGIITMEDVLEQIIGKPILDEFDEYENLRAVAARVAKKEHQEHLEPQKTTSEEPEVVE
jgi:CBS domain containing-hemolysin-like protein